MQMVMVFVIQKIQNQIVQPMTQMTVVYVVVATKIKIVMVTVLVMQQMIAVVYVQVVTQDMMQTVI